LWAQRAFFLAVLALAAVARTYNLRDLPAGLYCDEAALGYNAWAILHYGVDENGVRFPLFVWSFAGYKNPVYIYAAMLPIGLLGLDEFSVRLTSAIFGVGTVGAIYLLGRALLGPWIGLWAALLLAICPWHLHFSRIAFELISFPFLFALGFYFLVRFIQGRCTLPLAFFFLGSCVYAYALAKVFVPLFLLGFGILFLPTVWRRWREWAIAVPVLLLTVAPVVVFDLTHRQGMYYVYGTTVVRPGMALGEAARIFAANYRTYFSLEFLFRQGDLIARHAVRGHGELYPFFAPFLALGLVVLAGHPSRSTKLVLWWLLLYPAGASLMTEAPSASRGFIGAPAFCLIAAVGIASSLRVLGWIGHWPPLALLLQAAGVAGLGYAAWPQVTRYYDLYFHEYVKYSAPTYGGFQYGYREVVQYMESQRPNYDLLMMTAVEVNQPYIFALFYARRNPLDYARTHDPGYLILDPAEYRRYSMDQRILYALRESDLAYFSDYEVHRRVVAPGGQVEFVIADVKKRKQFITEWLTLGLFDNARGKGVYRDFVDVRDIRKRQYEGKFGPVFWRRMPLQFIRVDFNAFYAAQDRDHPGNPEEVCAYAFTTAEVPSARSGILEMSGSGDLGMVWLNGELLTPVAQRFDEAVRRRPVALVPGANALVVKSCESVGSWYVVARLTDERGNDMPDVSFRAEIPAAPLPEPTVSPSGRTKVDQVVEGFARILRFRHSDEYPDYRGRTLSWWAYGRDSEPEVVWETGACPRRATTALAFTASMGEQSGTAELWIDGQYALTFDLGLELPARHWARGPYRLYFEPREVVAGNSGIFVLLVPEEAIEAGKSLEIRVVPSGDSPNAWFMVKNYPDTAAFEHVTPALVAELEGPAWRE